MDKIYLNDKLVNADKAVIPVTDSGFLYGAGLFETMLCCNSTVFCLKDHLDRLFFSSKKLGIRIDHDQNSLSTAIYQVLKANQLTEARIRLTVSNGSISAETNEQKPTLLIAAAALQPYPQSYYQKGIRTVLCAFRQNSLDLLAGHKTTSYFARMAALKQAHQKNAAEAIWFTADSRLTEGCVSNCFLVKDSKVLTPPIETPVLPGVARKNICKIALHNQINLIERPLYIDDLLGADEVFLTNVIMKVIPVIAIEKHTVGKGIPGTVTQQLIAEFDKEINRQCQVK